MTTVTGTRPILTSLRDTLAFPSFAWCPHEYDIPPVYYRLRSDGVFTPFRHWCFLGEIIDITTIIRVRLCVRDRDGERRLPIAFHLDTRRDRYNRPQPAFRVISNDDIEAKLDHPNVPQHLLEKGNTIAVLYAERHLFVDGTIGLRIEDANLVQVFPCNMEKLFSVSDQILLANQADGLQGDRVCARCGEAAFRLCSSCRLARYCSKDCQIADWSDDGHKNQCKLTKQVTLLMKQDWQSFTKRYSFPLPKQ